MRIFWIVLVLAVSVKIGQGHPLSTSGIQDNESSPPSISDSPLNTIQVKLPETDSLKDDLHKTKNSAGLEESSDIKPESQLPNLKPEIVSSNERPESELTSAPATSESETPCSSSLNQGCESTLKPGNYFDQRHYDYDQRQNGSENYRIQVDGLVLVLAPVEALLLAGGLGSDMNGQFNFTSAFEQPNQKPDGESPSNISIKPESENSSNSVQKPLFYSAPRPTEG